MALIDSQISDLGVFQQILGAFSAIISTEEAIPLASGDRLLETATLTSLNKTMKDTSDAIDAIVLASQIPAV